MPLGTEKLRWSRILAPDVSVSTDAAGMTLQTATGHIKLSSTDAALVAHRLLATNTASLSDSLPYTDTTVLHRLDQLGLVAHRLENSDRHIITCIPLRASSDPKPNRVMAGRIHFASQAMVRARDGGLSMEMPGAWARVAVQDAKVLDLLPLLAAGCTATDCIKELAAERAPEWVTDVLCAFQWCGLVVANNQTEWAPHDLSLHAATRQGYARVPLGKTGQDSRSEPGQRHTVLARIDLSPPRQEDLVGSDPAFASVSGQRRSRRLHGDHSLTQQQLSEFLFRTLHQRDGHRPYPSGGACYPLTGYLALHHCADVPPGLYRYDAVAHSLDMVAETGTALNRLLAEAAASAGITDQPQILLILSACFAKTSSLYQDLSYSLILKEVGAVFQMAQLSAAAMGLAACPLGTGNALAFSALAGLDPLVETSVGELILGTSN